jgi:hypothetical protein
VPREVMMKTPCKGCSNHLWCAKHGCTFWNDDSRNRLAEVQRRAKEDDDLITAIQGDLRNGFWK